MLCFMLIAYHTDFGLRLLIQHVTFTIVCLFVMVLSSQTVKYESGGKLVSNISMFLDVPATFRLIVILERSWSQLVMKACFLATPRIVVHKGCRTSALML